MSAPGAAPFTGRTLHLLPLGLDPEHLALLGWLGATLCQREGFLPVQDPPLPIDRAWADPSRGQCSSNRIVDALVERSGGRANPEWTLALTSADLFAAGRDFVFGEAAVGGSWAVLSLARLGGPHDDTETLRSRLLVEALHELGHVAHLSHCTRPRCVMSRAALPGDVDRKSAEFCADCREALARGRPG